MNARSVILAITLFVFWLMLSGHYTVFLISCGAVSSVAIAMIAQRMHIVDEEAVPTEFFWGMFTYTPWLIWEIAKSAFGVARVIVSPKLAISPTMTVVSSRLKTQAGIATYGNSITLTPGTVTVNVQGKRLTVYALLNDGALDIEAGGMEDRVLIFEGGSK